MHSPIMPPLDTAGTCIRAARKRKGWSLDQLAEALGVSKTSVWGWETDKARPRASRLTELAELLDLPADRILNGSGAAENGPVEGRTLIEECQARIAEAFRVNPADVEIRVSFR